MTRIDFHVVPATTRDLEDCPLQTALQIDPRVIEGDSHVSFYPRTHRSRASKPVRAVRRSVANRIAARFPDWLAPDVHRVPGHPITRARPHWPRRHRLVRCGRPRTAAATWKRSRNPTPWLRPAQGRMSPPSLGKERCARAQAHPDT